MEHPFARNETVENFQILQTRQISLVMSVLDLSISITIADTYIIRSRNLMNISSLSLNSPKFTLIFIFLQPNPKITMYIDGSVMSSLSAQILFWNTEWLLNMSKQQNHFLFKYFLTKILYHHKLDDSSASFIQQTNFLPCSLCKNTSSYIEP